MSEYPTPPKPPGIWWDPPICLNCAHPNDATVNSSSVVCKKRKSHDWAPKSSELCQHYLPKEVAEFEARMNPPVKPPPPPPVILAYLVGVHLLNFRTNPDYSHLLAQHNLVLEQHNLISKDSQGVYVLNDNGRAVVNAMLEAGQRALVLQEKR